MNNKNWFIGSRFPPMGKPDGMFTFVVGFIIFAELFALGTLSYLGMFSRYMADDYCEIVILRDMPLLSTVFHNYINGGYRSSNRFSNLLFAGLSEMAGKHNVQLLPSLMVLLWLVGLFWAVNQFRKLAGFRWPVRLDLFVAVTVVFFSVWQAPNIFQTFLWRASMETHFAPLVTMALLSGYILYQIFTSKKTSLWASLFVFLASFLVGGFSEPPVAFMIVLIILSLPVVWRWNDIAKRRSAVNLLVCSFTGSFLALCAMFFAPGNLLHGTASFTNLITTFGQTFQFTFDFLVDTIKTLPLPSLFSILISFFVFLSFAIKSGDQTLASHRKRQIWMLIIFVPLIQCLLIAASFAPSAYGQSYPAERAQFLGRFIMTTALLVEGALLGVLCAQYRNFFSQRKIFFLSVHIMLFALALYPLRAGLVLLAEVPGYQKWASAWDKRDAEIGKAIASGEQDLVVRLLPPWGGVKEIDGDTRHWVNRCVAGYYEVNTIRSVPMGGG